MTDQPKSIAQRIRDAVDDVIEYEDRVAALNAALAAEGDDFQTAKFLSDRIGDRERKLLQRHQILDTVARSYLAQREQDRLSAPVTADLPRPIKDSPQA